VRLRPNARRAAHRVLADPATSSPLFFSVRPLTGGAQLLGSPLTFSRGSPPPPIDARARSWPSPSRPRLQTPPSSRSEAGLTLPPSIPPVTPLIPSILWLPIKAEGHWWPWPSGCRSPSPLRPIKARLGHPPPSSLQTPSSRIPSHLHLRIATVGAPTVAPLPPPEPPRRQWSVSDLCILLLLRAQSLIVHQIDSQGPLPRQPSAIAVVFHLGPPASISPPLSFTNSSPCGEQALPRLLFVFPEPHLAPPLAGRRSSAPKDVALLPPPEPPPNAHA
jgi:hypothetical protein